MPTVEAIGISDAAGVAPGSTPAILIRLGQGLEGRIAFVDWYDKMLKKGGASVRWDAVYVTAEKEAAAQWTAPANAATKLIQEDTNWDPKHTRRARATAAR